MANLIPEPDPPKPALQECRQLQLRIRSYPPFPPHTPLTGFRLERAASCCDYRPDLNDFSSEQDYAWWVRWKTWSDSGHGRSADEE